VHVKAEKRAVEAEAVLRLHGAGDVPLARGTALDQNRQGVAELVGLERRLEEEAASAKRHVSYQYCGATRPSVTLRVLTAMDEVREWHLCHP
jgi:hypothetical protein